MRICKQVHRYVNVKNGCVLSIFEDKGLKKYCAPPPKPKDITIFNFGDDLVFGKYHQIEPV